MTTTEPLLLTVTEELAGRRLDQVLVALVPDYSRARLQTWIKAGKVRVNGQTARPKDRMQAGDHLELTPEAEADPRWHAQAIALDILFEDDDLIVINKPAGLVVHPGAGNPDGTLVNALLHHDPALATVPRAGVVHRLDKDTSGLMVVAHSLSAHKLLVEQLQARSLTREYEAVVSGRMTAGGTVEAPIGRDPKHRTRQAVVGNGREATTHYRVITRFPKHTHARLQLESGRTHQIRVHMKHIGYPLVGDPVYAGRLQIPKGASATLADTLRNFGRQALHARRLELDHPSSGERLEWSAPRPADMQQLLDVLQQDARRT